MVYPRDVLNRLKWTKGESLDDAVISYVHRGARGDVMTISGEMIEGLRPGFFETRDTTIPYHRILSIEYRGKIIFERSRERRAR